MSAKSSWLQARPATLIKVSEQAAWVAVSVVSPPIPCAMASIVAGNSGMLCQVRFCWARGSCPVPRGRCAEMLQRAPWFLAKLLKILQSDEAYQPPEPA
jgi:hypothetical protein